jgi:hypothetical protein
MGDISHCHLEKDFRSMEESLAVVTKASTEFVGRWNRLISTTNWEKGRIIVDWRNALRDAGADPSSFTDEVWSQQVGGVTPQHVGRLRRVSERFGQTYEDYPGLYWSHFQVAVEWPDAEMYLEGAVQSHWSVARMCDQRWEALGSPEDSKPQESDIVASEVDEDITAVNKTLSSTISESMGEVHNDDSHFDDANDSDSDRTSFDDGGADDSDTASGSEAVADPDVYEPVRPFEGLPAMPADMNEAFELFKLAILNHKVSGWQEIARNDVFKVLDSLKVLALAPTE